MSLEQAQIELRMASSYGNLEELILRTQTKTLCKQPLKNSIEKMKKRLAPGSVIVFRSAPPIQYTPTWPSGTW